MKLIYWLIFGWFAPFMALLVLVSSASLFTPKITILFIGIVGIFLLGTFKIFGRIL